MDFVVPADNRVKFKDGEKKDKYLDLAKGLKKLWNMKVAATPIAIGAFGTVTGRIGTRTGGLRNNRTSEENPNSIAEIDQNTEKSPGDWRNLLSLKLL